MDISLKLIVLIGIFIFLIIPFIISFIVALCILKREPQINKVRSLKEIVEKRQLYLHLSLLTKTVNICMSICGLVSNVFVLYLANDDKEGVVFFCFIYGDRRGFVSMESRKKKYCI